MPTRSPGWPASQHAANGWPASQRADRLAGQPACAVDRLAGQPTRAAARPYTSANPASATRPRSVPFAARAANAAPCSSAAISSTGPTIAGNALTSPPIRGPNRRAASVAAPTSAGATTSSRTRSTKQRRLVRLPERRPVRLDGDGQLAHRALSLRGRGFGRARFVVVAPLFRPPGRISAVALIMDRDWLAARLEAGAGSRRLRGRWASTRRRSRTG